MSDLTGFGGFDTHTFERIVEHSVMARELRGAMPPSIGITPGVVYATPFLFSPHTGVHCDSFPITTFGHHTTKHIQNKYRRLYTIVVSDAGHASPARHTCPRAAVSPPPPPLTPQSSNIDVHRTKVVEASEAWCGGEPKCSRRVKLGVVVSRSAVIPEVYLTWCGDDLSDA